MAIPNLILSALATLAVYGAAKALRSLLRPLFSPLRVLPAPPSRNFITGNLNTICMGRTHGQHEWIEKYGRVMKCKGILGQDFLFAIDTKAVDHVLSHSTDYQRAPLSRFMLSRLVGEGLLAAEGEKHRQQRRIMNPSFGPSSIKDLTPIFFEKSLELRDIWKSQIESHTENPGNAHKIEVTSWLSRATLDIIGLAGFHYRFESLDIQKEQSMLNKAFTTVLSQAGGSRVFTVLQFVFPPFRAIPTKVNTRVAKAKATMRMVGKEMLSARREGGELEKGRDILSALVRANTDSQLPESKRMSDEDVLSQVPTFLAAGHETTSTQTTWALFALSQKPEIQARLRAELRQVQTDSPSVDDLGPEHLPFLDAVVHEVLRLHAAVSSVLRVATKDDVIPFAEPFVDKTGEVHREIRIQKGEGVVIPILAMNRSKEIWGEDSTEFNPDRWFNPPAAARDIPGIWGDMLTFIGGARGCIGYKFAIIEMKALLFTLLRAFEFSLAIPVEKIELRAIAVTRPFIRGEEGVQMPFMIRVCET